MAKHARKKGLEFTCTIDPKVALRLRGDPARLRQVLTNVAANGVKFTERGHVKTHVSPVDDGEESTRLRFTVSDTGIGIPEKGVVG